MQSSVHEAPPGSEGLAQHTKVLQRPLHTKVGVRWVGVGRRWVVVGVSCVVVGFRCIVVRVRCVVIEPFDYTMRSDSFAGLKVGTADPNQLWGCRQ